MDTEKGAEDVENVADKPAEESRMEERTEEPPEESTEEPTEATEPPEPTATPHTQEPQASEPKAKEPQEQEQEPQEAQEAQEPQEPQEVQEVQEVQEPQGQSQETGSPAGDKSEGPPPRALAPRNEYLTFREMLKHESAVPLAAKLQEFVRQFPGGLPREQAADRVHKFLSATQEWMLSSVQVFVGADEAGQTSAAEGLEKFLMSRVHGKVFCVEKTDPEEDDLLRQRIDSLSWVGFTNLGVPSVDVSLLDLAVDQLQSMDKFKAPRDKMVCILNACRVINDVLQRAIVESGNGRPLSADDFLPMLIFCVILANPPRLHSNIEFVAAFRHPTRLVAEDAYFLTALQSSVAFVKDAGPKVLDVSEEEFKQFCSESLAAKGYAADGTKIARPEDEKGIQSVRQLRVGDLPDLLDEYRALRLEVDISGNDDL
ncbi:unnamed protein product [Effrenium voratum]|nr:unnamed protein product [Effrenium voratum]